MITPRDFGIRPLFYDAVSQEFLPPSDSLKRAHTLGRLIVATCEKGALTSDQFISGVAVPRNLSHYPQLTYTYRPSWAPAEVTVVQQTRGVAFVEGIQLRSLDSDDAMAVYDVTDTDSTSGRALQIVESGVERLPLQLGHHLHEARSLTSQAAQSFFSRIAL